VFDGLKKNNFKFQKFEFCGMWIPPSSRDKDALTKDGANVFIITRRHNYRSTTADNSGPPATTAYETFFNIAEYKLQDGEWRGARLIVFSNPEHRRMPDDIKGFVQVFRDMSDNFDLNKDYNASSSMRLGNSGNSSANRSDA
jgi:hypothetical protein